MCTKYSVVRIIFSILFWCHSVEQGLIIKIKNLHIGDALRASAAEAGRVRKKTFIYILTKRPSTNCVIFCEIYPNFTVLGTRYTTTTVLNWGTMPPLFGSEQTFLIKFRTMDA